MKYQVTYTAHVTGCVEVEADSTEEAFDKARPLAEASAPTNDHLELDWPPTEEEGWISRRLRRYPQRRE